MHIEIKSRGFEMTPGLRNYIMRRFTRPLDFARGRAHRASVYLTDENGPRCIRRSTAQPSGPSMRSRDEWPMRAANGSAARAMPERSSPSNWATPMTQGHTMHRPCQTQPVS